MEELQIRYALISNNIVENVIICNDPEHIKTITGYDHIELLDTETENKTCGVGLLWDKANGSFYLPEPPKEMPVIFDVFIQRFTKTERIALYTKESSDMRVKVELEDLKVAPIFYDNQEVIDFMEYLVTIGVIEQPRIAEILSNEIII